VGVSPQCRFSPQIHEQSAAEIILRPVDAGVNVLNNIVIIAT
jgi:hypothetical protein